MQNTQAIADPADIDKGYLWTAAYNTVVKYVYHTKYKPMST